MMSTDNNGSKDIPGTGTLYAQGHHEPSSDGWVDFELGPSGGEITLQVDSFNNVTLGYSQSGVSGYQSISFSIIFALGIPVGKPPIELVYPSPESDFQSLSTCRTDNFATRHFILESGKVFLSRPAEDNYTATFEMTLVERNNVNVKMYITNGRFDVTGFPVTSA